MIPGLSISETFSAVLAGLHNLAPNIWRERMLCAWLLGHAPLTTAQQHEATRALGKVVQNQHAPRPQQIRSQLQTAALRALPLTGILAIWATSQLVENTGYNHFAVSFTTFSFMVEGMFALLYVPLFFGLLPFSAALNIHRGNRVRVAAILALARLRAPEFIGPLSRAALDVSHGIRVVAEESLRQCLPQITPDHYGRLDADTVPALCKLLDVKKERLFAGHLHTEQLVLDVLDALGKIGDGGAVRHVESVAEDGWTSPVRDAAHQILPLLRLRQQQENEPRLLLRGSTPPPASPDQLLRPTLPAPHAAPEQLLRSGSRE